MDPLETLHRYLDGHLYGGADAARQPRGRPIYPFITISREAGAGGHALAEALLAAMSHRPEPLYEGWKIIDAGFCARILQDAKLVASLESLDKEETRSAWEEAIFELLGGRASSNRVFRLTLETIRLLACFGKIIIIGRGGACGTRDLPHGIHVRLVAPKEIRVQRLKTLRLISDSEARRQVEEYDAERAKFVRTHFGRDIQDPLIYDVTWNTGSLAPNDIAPLLVDLIKSRAAEAVTV